MTCRICGERIRWMARRFAWRHLKAGADHGPIPARVVIEIRR